MLFVNMAAPPAKAWQPLGADQRPLCGYTRHAAIRPIYRILSDGRQQLSQTRVPAGLFLAGNPIPQSRDRVSSALDQGV